MNLNEIQLLNLIIKEEQCLLDIVTNFGKLYYQINYNNNDDNEIRRKQLAVIGLFEEFWTNIPLPNISEWERNKDSNNNNRSFYINVSSVTTSNVPSSMKIIKHILSFGKNGLKLKYASLLLYLKT